MNSILLPAAFAIALAGGSVVAAQHRAAVHGDTVILADAGGGDGGSDRRAVETADAGGGDGGMDRRAVETADGSGGGDGGFDRRVAEQA